MTVTMNAELEALIPLQQTDIRIAELRAAIAALPKHLAALETKLQSQKAALEAAEKSLKDEEARRRRLESDIKDQQQKGAKFRDQLNTVKTNEQFQALQHEIGFAEKEIRRIEDVELESMERTERLEEQRKSAQQDLAAQIRLVDSEKEHARQASGEQQQALDALTAERATLRTKVSERTLTVYDRVAKGRGTGLARAQGQRCVGCQMGLRPQLWNQVRNGEMEVCESCGRLLYFDPALEPAVAPPEPEKPKRRKSSAETGEAAE